MKAVWIDCSAFMKLPQGDGCPLVHSCPGWRPADWAGVTHLDWRGSTLGLFQVGKIELEPDERLRSDGGIDFLVDGLYLKDIGDTEPGQLSDALSSLKAAATGRLIGPVCFAPVPA